jgi:hypothetical protein
MLPAPESRHPKAYTLNPRRSTKPCLGPWLRSLLVRFGLRMVQGSGFRVQGSFVDVVCDAKPYRGTSLIRKRPSLGPYSSLMPRALWWS